MRNTVLLLGLAAMMFACNAFNPEKMRGTYKVELKELMDENEGEEDGFGAALGKALVGSLNMELVFEDEGKGEIKMGMGLLQDLADAFGAESEVSDTPMGKSFQWKMEGMDLYIDHGDTEGYQLFGTVVEHDGYDKIILELDDDQEKKRITMTKQD